jgi:hypothetical protein
LVISFFPNVFWGLFIDIFLAWYGFSFLRDAGM